MSKGPGVAASAGLKVGDLVGGRFRITGTVGRGAMGAVYAAEHEATGQAVALKFMILGDDDEQFSTRFELEARVMAGLRHPNTIRIYDFGRTDDGAMFMAMELLVGHSLDAVIRENMRRGTTMSEPEAANYTIQVLKSLAEAHGNGLVHRDLKPGNIFLTDDGGGETLVKVLDFGIARVQGSALTNAGRILGTPSYMSPEQWQGSKVDGRADIYAVGCVLYCCVTGQPPYLSGDNMFELMSKHCTAPVPDPRGLARQPLSDGLVQVITTALAKDPSDRFADARAMRAAIEAVVGGAWAGTPARTMPTTQNIAMPTKAPTLVSGTLTDLVGEHAPEDTLVPSAQTLVPTKPASRVGSTLSIDAAPPADDASPKHLQAPTLLPVPVPVAPAEPAAAQSKGSSLARIGVAVLVLALLGGVAAWWLLRGDEPVATLVVATTAPSPRPVADQVPAAAVAVPVAPVAVDVPVAVETPVAAPEVPAAAPAVPAADPVQPAPVAAESAAPAAPTVAAPAAELPRKRDPPRSGRAKPTRSNNDAPTLQMVD